MVMLLAATPRPISHIPGSLRFIHNTHPSIAYDARWPATAATCGIDGQTVMTTTCNASAATTIHTPRNRSVVRRPSDPPHSGVSNTSTSAQRPRNTSHHLQPGRRHVACERLAVERCGDAVTRHGPGQIEPLHRVGAHGLEHLQGGLVL